MPPKFDDAVMDEMFRVNNRNITFQNGVQEVMSDFEYNVDQELREWAQQNVHTDPGLKYHNSVYSMNKFWNERLA